jgi:hypothetical protein
MKKEYQVYKRHHNNKFIGWEVGYYRRNKKDGEIKDVVVVATFYNPHAKEHAERFVDDLEF